MHPVSPKPDRSPGGKKKRGCHAIVSSGIIIFRPRKGEKTDHRMEKEKDAAKSPSVKERVGGEVLRSRKNNPAFARGPVGRLNSAPYGLEKRRPKKGPRGNQGRTGDNVWFWCLARGGPRLPSVGREITQVRGQNSPSGHVPRKRKGGKKGSRSNPTCGEQKQETIPREGKKEGWIWGVLGRAPPGTQQEGW